MPFLTSAHGGWVARPFDFCACFSLSRITRTHVAWTWGSRWSSGAPDEAPPAQSSTRALRSVLRADSRRAWSRYETCRDCRRLIIGSPTSGGMGLERPAEVRNARQRQKVWATHLAFRNQSAICRAWSRYETCHRGWHGQALPTCTGKYRPLFDLAPQVWAAAACPWSPED